MCKKFEAFHSLSLPVPGVKQYDDDEKQPYVLNITFQPEFLMYGKFIDIELTCSWESTVQDITNLLESEDLITSEDEIKLTTQTSGVISQNTECFSLKHEKRLIAT